jgi:hypothetical protein
MSLQVLMVIHSLPLWFLVFALFLPRIALFVLYMDQGISLWFIIHLVVALMVWGGSGSYSARRRHRNDY